MSTRGRDVLCGVALGAGVAAGVAAWLSTRDEPTKRRKIDRRSEIVDGVAGLVGNTPLVRIASLSELTGCEILGKAEFLNPGGSVKDRVALQSPPCVLLKTLMLPVIDTAERDGLLVPHTGSRIFEGTVGSTGISIATIARARGYDATIFMPDDVAAEKAEILLKLGADVQKVRPVPIASPHHYVNQARRAAQTFGVTTLAGDSEDGDAELVVTSTRGARGLFADQFESLANYEAHLHGTGPEIWAQTAGRIDAFVAGAGTAGTIAGVARCLKSHKHNVKIVLADPQGSGLLHRVKHGVMYATQESEGKRRRHQVDTVVEGIGINRVTRNFAEAEPMIDDAIGVTDAKAVAMSRHLVQSDGLWLGSSSACNLVAAVRLARTLPKGATIVTILCDSGSRHVSRFWNDQYLASVGVPISSDISML